MVTRSCYEIWIASFNESKHKPGHKGNLADNFVCEAWYVILRKQHRVREIENRQLRKILGTKKEEVKENRGVKE